MTQHEQLVGELASALYAWIAPMLGYGAAFAVVAICALIVASGRAARRRRD